MFENHIPKTLYDKSDSYDMKYVKKICSFNIKTIKICPKTEKS
jgi:hypothetical protein